MEIGNNTSTASSFAWQTNGNAGACNVSKLPIQFSAVWWIKYQNLCNLAWMFGQANHMTVGYTSDTTAQVHAQVEDMISPDIQSAIADWYGRSNASIEAATTLLKNKAEAHSGKLEFAIMEEGLHCRLRPTALVASANPGTPVSAMRCADRRAASL